MPASFVARRRRPGRPGVVAVVVLALAGALLAVPRPSTSSPPPAPAAAPSPPAPTPRPSSPEPSPVTGHVEVSVLPVSNGPVVYTPGDPLHEAPPADEAAVEAMADTVVHWLDAHLTDLRRGGDGLLADVAAADLPVTEATAASDALVAPGAPDAEVAYDVLVGVDGLPTWLRVEVEVAVDPEEMRRSSLVFVPGPDGPVLIAARSLAAPVPGDDPLVLLLLGADDGPMRGGSPLRARADAFHLLVLTPERGHVTLLNIPRDLWVPVPGRGTTKINACLVNGPDACVVAVERHWNLDVDGYVLTDFSGFRAALDRYPVEIDVDRRLTDGGQDIDPGRQSLDGAEALTWVRDRKNRPDGDFGRTFAQAELLKALHHQLVGEGPSVGRLAELVGVVQASTITDLSPEILLRLAFAAVRLSPAEVENHNVPGRVGTAGEASVVFPAPGADALVADAADGRVDGD